MPQSNLINVLIKEKAITGTGTLIIKGIASSNTLDRQMEALTITPNALSRALPLFMAKGAPIKVEHSKTEKYQDKEVGQVLEMDYYPKELNSPVDTLESSEPPHTQIMVTAEISDLEAIKDVLKGWLNSFSLRWLPIRFLIDPFDRTKEIHTEIEIDELTICNTPVNPDSANFEIINLNDFQVGAELEMYAQKAIVTGRTYENNQDYVILDFEKVKSVYVPVTKADNEFNEDKVNRDKDGQFASSSSSGGANLNPEPKNEPVAPKPTQAEMKQAERENKRKERQAKREAKKQERERIRNEKRVKRDQKKQEVAARKEQRKKDRVHEAGEITDGQRARFAKRIEYHKQDFPNSKITDKVIGDVVKVADDAFKKGLFPGMTLRQVRGSVFSRFFKMDAGAKVTRKTRQLLSGVKKKAVEFEDPNALISTDQIMLNVVGTTYDLLILIHGYHWNVRGQDFQQYHQYYAELYNGLFEDVDQYAEHLRSMDTNAPVGIMALNRYSKLATDEESESFVSIQGTLNEIYFGFNQLKDLVGLAQKYAGREGYTSLQNFLQEKIDGYNKILWQLKSSLENTLEKSKAEVKLDPEVEKQLEAIYGKLKAVESVEFDEDKVYEGLKSGIKAYLDGEDGGNDFNQDDLIYFQYHIPPFKLTFGNPDAQRYETTIIIGSDKQMRFQEPVKPLNKEKAKFYTKVWERQHDKQMESKSQNLDEVFKKYHETVNMGAKELQKWAENPYSRLASLSRAPIRRNLALLSKPKDKWTSRDVTNANKTIAFISRMKNAEQGAKLKVDGKEIPYSKRDIALRNWAYKS